MRLTTAPVSIRSGEVDAPVEVKRSVGIDINVQSLEISGSIDESLFSSLQEIIRDNDVLLVGSHFDVVRSDGGLFFIGIIKALGLV